MICQSCGKENPESAAACQACGQPLIQPTLPETAPLPIATIRLRRASKFTAVFTRFEVYIDGVVVGSLATGEQAQYEVPPGRRLVQVKVDTLASKTVSFTLGPGETIRLACSPKVLGMGVNLGLDKECETQG